MSNETRPHNTVSTRNAPCPDDAERTRSARRRRSTQRASDGVITAYLHDLSRRRPTMRPRPV